MYSHPTYTSLGPTSNRNTAELKVAALIPTQHIHLLGLARDSARNARRRDAINDNTVGRRTRGRPVLVVLLDHNAVVGDARELVVGPGHVLDGASGAGDGFDAEAVLGGGDLRGEWSSRAPRSRRVVCRGDGGKRLTVLSCTNTLATSLFDRPPTEPIEIPWVPLHCKFAISMLVPELIATQSS